MSELTKAIIAAGEELCNEHGWGVCDEDKSEIGSDCVFVKVLVKHINPLLDVEQMKRIRIATLKAELSVLEGQ